MFDFKISNFWAAGIKTASLCIEDVGTFHIAFDTESADYWHAMAVQGQPLVYDETNYNLE